MWKHRRGSGLTCKEKLANTKKDLKDVKRSQMKYKRVLNVTKNKLKEVQGKLEEEEELNDFITGLEQHRLITEGREQGKRKEQERRKANLQAKQRARSRRGAAEKENLKHTGAQLPAEDSDDDGDDETESSTMSEGVYRSPVHINCGGSAQAAIVLARMGQCLPASEDYVYFPLLYHIVFHSLGSRLYKIRERTGLFYGAQGILGSHVRADHPGMDIIATKVEPSDVNKTIDELKNLVQQLRTDPQIREHELIAAQSWYEHQVLQTVTKPATFASLIIQYKRLYPDKTNYADLIHEHLHQINTMTVPRINRLARKIFAAPYDNIYISN